MERLIEVEYRCNLYLKPKILRVFPDAKAEGGVSIIDTYFLFKSDGEQHRVRQVSGPEWEKHYQMKKHPLDGFLVENSSPLGRADYESLIGSTPAVVTVSGYREAFKHGSLTLCADDLPSIGTWTEFEILVATESEVSRAEAEIIAAVKRLDVDPDKLTKELYPSLVLKKNGRTYHC